jgi:hypothetical protein
MSIYICSAFVFSCTGKVRLHYEPGYVIICVGNLTEEKFYVFMFEFPLGV